MKMRADIRQDNNYVWFSCGACSDQIFGRGGRSPRHWSRLRRKAIEAGWLFTRLPNDGKRPRRNYAFCPECVKAGRTTYSDVLRRPYFKPEPPPIGNAHEAAQVVLAAFPQALVDSTKHHHIIRKHPDGDVLGTAVSRNEAWMEAAKAIRATVLTK